MFKKNRALDSPETKSLRTVDNSLKGKKSILSTKTNSEKKPGSSQPLNLTWEDKQQNFCKKCKTHAVMKTIPGEDHLQDQSFGKKDESKTSLKSSSYNPQLGSSSKSKPERRSIYDPKYLKKRKEETPVLKELEISQDTEPTDQLDKILANAKHSMEEDEIATKKVQDKAERIQKSNEVKDKVMSVHKSGYKLCQQFIEHFEKIGESAGDSGVGQKFVENLQIMKDKFMDETRNQESFVDEIVRCIECLKPENDQSRLLSERERTQFNICIEAYKGKLKETEQKIKNVEELNAKIIKDLEKQLSEHTNSNKEKNIEVQKAEHVKKSLLDEKKTVDAKHELLLKDVTDVKKKLQECLNEFKHLKSRSGKLSHLNETDFDKDFRSLYEAERKQCENLKKVVSDTYDEIEKLKGQLSEKQKPSEFTEDDAKLSKELNTLRKSCQKTAEEKNEIENEKKKLDKILEKNQFDKIKDDLEKIKLSNKKLEISAKDMSDSISAKSKQIKELKQELNNVCLRYKEEVEMIATAQVRNDFINKEIIRLRTKNEELKKTNDHYYNLLKNRDKLLKYFPKNKNSVKAKAIDRNFYTSGDISDLDIYSDGSYQEMNAMSSLSYDKDTELAKEAFTIKVLENSLGKNMRYINELEDRNTLLEKDLSEVKRVIKFQHQNVFL